MEFWSGSRPSVVTTSCPRGRNLLADPHRFVQQAAGIPAQVENHAFMPCAFSFLERVLQFITGLVAELR